MAEEKVRIYDFTTKAITTIPASELAPGMIRAEVQGIVGEVWIDAKDAKSGPTRQPPFCLETRELLSSLHSVLQEVYPLSFEKWEEGFRRDAHPEQEIAIWSVIADVFKHFTEGRDFSSEQKKDIFDVIIAGSNSPKENVRFITNSLTLSKKRTGEIVDWLFSKRSEIPEIRDRLLWARQQANEPPKNDRSVASVASVASVNSLKALLDENHDPDDDPRPAFRFADVVLGTNAKTGEHLLVFGREALAAAQTGSATKPLLILRVGIDAETDELEKLCGLCLAQKGSYEPEPQVIRLG